MRNNDILDSYKDYLYNEVVDSEHNLADYSLLLSVLFDIPFESFNPMDNNRISDAFNMRMEYLDSEFGEKCDYFVVKDRYISVLEVLIALGKRLFWDIMCDPMLENDDSHLYFWEFLRNLDVEKYSNDNFKELNIRDKVKKWVCRDFKKDGSGSIFPLKKAKTDQRKEEIWNQMQCYLMENY